MRPLAVSARDRTQLPHGRVRVSSKSGAPLMDVSSQMLSQFRRCVSRIHGGMPDGWPPGWPLAQAASAREAALAAWAAAAAAAAVGGGRLSGAAGAALAHEAGSAAAPRAMAAEGPAACSMRTRAAGRPVQPAGLPAYQLAKRSGMTNGAVSALSRYLMRRVGVIDTGTRCKSQNL